MVDGLSLMWGLLVAGMGALIVLYSHWYLHEHEALGRYYGFLIAFMGSMLGVVFSDHLISLFIFWELTSITSFFLIGFWSDRDASNYGATKAILITGSGGLAMLGGFLLLGDVAGEWRLSELVLMPDIASQVSLGVFLLIILGAATKSAQWPFHIWLPNAMEAPTPISAFLHSATMVKAGIYLLSRFYPILGAHPAWGYVVTGFGMTTMIAGGLLSLRAYDLKAILAYGTISQLGLIVTFLGYGGKGAIIGATLHLYNHAAAKAAMFMTVGIIDHEAGTRDVRLLGNLKKLMPKTHVLAVIAALSLIGIPPMGGFITKEMLYEVSLHPGGPGSWSWFWPYLTVFAGVFTALYHLRFLSEPYWQAAEGEAPKHPHDPPLGMLAAPAILVLLALAFGLAPGLIENAIVAPAAMATLGGGAKVELHLGLWHGINTPLIMSVITMALGLALYFGFAHVKTVLDACARIWGKAPAPDRIYDGFVNWLREGTWEILLLIQDGNLRTLHALDVRPAHRRRSLSRLAVGLGGERIPKRVRGRVVPAHRHRAHDRGRGPRDGALQAKNRGHPRPRHDGLRHRGAVPAPESARSGPHPDHGRIGLGRTLPAGVLLPARAQARAVIGGEEDARLGHRDRSRRLYDARHGRRHEHAQVPHDRRLLHAHEQARGGLQERGERHHRRLPRLRHAGRDHRAGHRRHRRLRPHAAGGRDEMRSLILRTIAPVVLHLTLLFSMFLLIYGHNQPGGGFIAGLMTAVGIVLQWIAVDEEEGRRRFNWPYEGIFLAGLALSTLTGVWGYIKGAYLKSSIYRFELPFIGDVELFTAFLFDVGVYGVVVGVVMCIFTNLCEEEAKES